MKKIDEIDKIEMKKNREGGMPPTQQRILVAEDDDGISDIFRIIFAEAGYITDLKTNGADLLKNEFEIPDLFLIDKNLPGSNGLDICLFLKSQKSTRHIPVILISAAPDIGSLSREVRADAYVKKPFDIAQLLNMVRYHIHK